MRSGIIQETRAEMSRLMFCLLVCILLPCQSNAQIGDIVWTQKLDKSPAGDCRAMAIYATRVTSNGDIAIVGDGYSEDTVPEAGGLLLFRLNPSGKPLWGKVYRQFRGYVGTSVFETADGGFIVIGVAQYSAKFAYDKANLVLRTDVSGNVIGSRVYPVTGSAIHNAYATANGFVGVVADSGNTYMEAFDSTGLLSARTKIAAQGACVQIATRPGGGYFVGMRDADSMNTHICRLTPDISTLWKASLFACDLQWNIYQDAVYIRSTNLLCTGGAYFCLTPLSSKNFRLFKVLDGGATDTVTINWAKSCTYYNYVTGMCSAIEGGFLFSPAGRDIFCCDLSGNRRWELRNVNGSYHDGNDCYGQVAFADSLGKGFFIASDNLDNGPLLYKFGPHFPPKILYPPNGLSVTIKEDTVFSLNLQVLDTFPGSVVKLSLGDTLHQTALFQGTTFNWTPDEPYKIHDTLTLKVTDRVGQQDSVRICVNVIPVNDPPIFARKILADTAYCQVPYQKLFHATDQDDSIFSYSITDAPIGCTIGTATGLLKWTPPLDTMSRSFSMHIVASDGKLADTAVLKLSVMPLDSVYPPGRPVVLPIHAAETLTVAYDDGTVFRIALQGAAPRCSTITLSYPVTPLAAPTDSGWTIFSISGSDTNASCWLCVSNPKFTSTAEVFRQNTSPLGWSLQFATITTGRIALSFYGLPKTFAIAPTTKLSRIVAGTRKTIQSWYGVRAASGQLLVSIPSGNEGQTTICIYNLYGRLVYQWHPGEIQGEVLKINLSGKLASGIYLAKVSIPLRSWQCVVPKAGR
jgi:hypothetical protein